MAIASNIISQAKNSISFSDATNLNVTYKDLLEDGISISFDDPSYEQIKCASDMIISAGLIRSVSVSVNLAFVSSQYQSWFEQDTKSPPSGTAKVTTDKGMEYEIHRITIEKQEEESNGKSGGATFMLKGFIYTNQDLVQG